MHRFHNLVEFLFLNKNQGLTAFFRKSVFFFLVIAVIYLQNFQRWTPGKWLLKKKQYISIHRTYYKVDILYYSSEVL